MIQILKTWASGQQPTTPDLNYLEQLELADKQRATAFNITRENVSATIKVRSQFFCSLLQQNSNVSCLFEQLETLWKLWLPLGIQLAEHRQQLGRPLVQGILGSQGTGKTTLAKVLTLILSQLNYCTIGLSLDDLYKTYAERQQLQSIDPRLIWRGPPGTHDIELGIKVIDQLRQPISNQQVAIPRFDKSLWNGAGDRTNPEQVSNIDIVLLEGWFVGCRPIDESKFDDPPSPIITETDQQFARDMNIMLQNYVPLWDKLDQLIVLKPLDYRLSKRWRLQAEHEMIATGKPGMTDAEIDQFVDYFWKALHPELFISPLINNPEFVNLVIEINADHQIEKIYRPL